MRHTRCANQSEQVNGKTPTVELGREEREVHGEGAHSGVIEPREGKTTPNLISTHDTVPTQCIRMEIQATLWDHSHHSDATNFFTTHA